MTVESLPARVPPGSLNPADLSPLPPVAASAEADIDAAFAAARAAQPGWAALSFDARAEKLLGLARAMHADQANGAKIMSQETGRSELECLMSELVSVVEYMQGAIKAGRGALAPEKVGISMLNFPGKKAVIEAVPRGVVAIIAPWNYPVGNFMKSLPPALLSGCGVVIKPSEHTPRSGAWLAGLCAKVFPAGLVSLVQGEGSVGQALVERADAVVFTGSVPSGRRVSVRCAERLIPCSAELGGKDAAIVLADCDPERTALGVAQWAFHNAGQNCAAIERVYVEESVADAFVERLARVASRLRVADGKAGFSDLGPLQNPAQLAIVEKHVEEAVKLGAVVKAGGARTGQGLGYQPTVLDRCTHQMKAVMDETFGPIVAVIRVKDAEEAVKQANDSPYGLNGSVWTADIAKGEALARRLHVGVALVNNHAFTGGTLPELPWTGVKDTGTGVAASRHTYPTFVRRRAVLTDSNKAPDPWWFPANEDLKAFSAALIEKQGGSFGAMLKLGGLLGKRIKAIKALAQG